MSAIGEGENVRGTLCPSGDTETLPEKLESLMKMMELLQKDIDQELRFAKENCRTRPREALEVLTRMKWRKNHLHHIDCVVKNIRDLVNTLTELITDLSDNCTSASHGVEFNEAELRAELERLTQNEDPFSMSLFELDRVEQRIPCPEMSPTVPPTPPDEMEDEEIEHQLEYLRRWACS